MRRGTVDGSSCYVYSTLEHARDCPGRDIYASVRRTQPFTYDAAERHLCLRSGGQVCTPHQTWWILSFPVFLAFSILVLVHNEDLKTLHPSWPHLSFSFLHES
jgi:hypothetical protein